MEYNEKAWESMFPPSEAESNKLAGRTLEQMQDENHKDQIAALWKANPALWDNISGFTPQMSVDGAIDLNARLDRFRDPASIRLASNQLEHFILFDAKRRENESMKMQKEENDKLAANYQCGTYDTYSGKAADMTYHPDTHNVVVDADKLSGSNIANGRRSGDAAPEPMQPDISSSLNELWRKAVDNYGQDRQPIGIVQFPNEQRKSAYSDMANQLWGTEWEWKRQFEAVKEKTRNAKSSATQNERFISAYHASVAALGKDASMSDVATLMRVYLEM